MANNQPFPKPPTHPATAGIHLALLKVHGFMAINTEMRKQDAISREGVALFFGLHMGLLIGQRDVHSARLILEATSAANEGLIKNVIDELLAVVGTSEL